MKLRTRLSMQVASLCLLAASSFAADNAYLNLVNAIPGKDVANHVSPSYPVDVLISGPMPAEEPSLWHGERPLQLRAGKL